MAIRFGADRNQVMVFPERMEDYVDADDPVRVYDAFVNALDFTDLGIEEDQGRPGNPAYDPRAMVKLLLYGYSYGIFSSRKLERAVHHNISFIWLVGGLKPDHKTIAEFRRNNKESLGQVLGRCARICLKLDLVDGNILFVDSTKIWASAANAHQHKKSWYTWHLEKVKVRIQEILKKCEAVDAEECDKASLVKMPKALARERHLQDTIQKAPEEFEDRGAQDARNHPRRVNRVDPESARMMSARGSHPSFLVQTVVDDKNGLITSVDAVSDGNDFHQMPEQITQAEENLGQECEAACADAGYYDMLELARLETEKRSVIVPSPKQITGKEPKPFAKEHFVYDPEKDCFICPMGNRLRFLRFCKKENSMREYRIERVGLCRECEHYGVCTSAKKGRSVLRHIHEDLKERIAQRYQEPENRKIYSRRKERAEHPFGYMKKAMGFRQFFLRGRAGARVEASLLAMGYNLKRMIALTGGVELTVGKLAAA